MNKIEELLERIDVLEHNLESMKGQRDSVNEELKLCKHGNAGLLMEIDRLQRQNRMIKECLDSIVNSILALLKTIF